MKNRLIAYPLVIFATCTFILGQETKADSESLQYKLLATTRTSTMQKEITETAEQGYRIVVGSPTSGSEMALFLSRDGTVKDPYQYKLLATTRTGTMQKEMNEASDAGFRLIPSTMIAKKQMLGGVEIIMIMERPPKPTRRYEYKLLATNRTATLQREVTEAKAAGYVVVGMVSRDEHMVVVERESAMTP